MMFTDPPCNVPIDGNVAGIQQSRYREFAMAAGEMSPAEYRAFLEQSLTAMLAWVAPGAIMFMCVDWRQLQLLLELGATLARSPGSWRVHGAASDGVKPSRAAIVLTR